MRLITFLFFLILSLNVPGHESRESTANNLKVGRYSSVSTEPTHAQIDLLSVIIQLDFSYSINTVGQALEILLINSGYRLADLDAVDPNLSILLHSPLPSVHRSLGPVSLRTALNTLSGSTWDLVVDPVHRLITFELINDYRLTLENKVISHE